ncbi:hypothetical protein PFICI_09770 [Pestalotiopsis fici W106-1]|uniref:Uncharacterized protein n=1 Tax=Pestalotiopsis fici (strain W106-1 / CGMCC3.15140) TaxID=1229662 RepID=W3WV15_PESFW|nr:uncharacterized protein PFICI_09770 [Pestalotiopsis fici W106-1]ETS77708.1 hypothetical protein PFICI_09770 [Pestalotiopsis fici W106-1]
MSSWVSLWPSERAPVCAEHMRTTCHDCLQSYNCDSQGEYSPEVWYDSKEPRRTDIYFGKHALFIPQIDTHLGLTAGLNANSTNIGKFNVLEDIEFNSNNLILPPPMAPDKEWCVECPKCNLMWMVGVEGLYSAASHPAHRVMRDKRTLVCWAGVQPLGEFDRQSEVEYRAAYYFGHLSKFNGSTKDDSPNKALLTTIIEMLRKVRFSVLPERCALIAEAAKSNSEVFLEKARIFRLVVMVSDPDFIDFIVAMRTCVWWKPQFQTWRTLDGEMMDCTYKLGSYDLLHEIEEEIEALSQIGILVKWYPVHESINIATNLNLTQLKGKEALRPQNSSVAMPSKPSSKLPSELQGKVKAAPSVAYPMVLPSVEKETDSSTEARKPQTPFIDMPISRKRKSDPVKNGTSSPPKKTKSESIDLDDLNDWNRFKHVPIETLRNFQKDMSELEEKANSIPIHFKQWDSTMKVPSSQPRKPENAEEGTGSSKKNIQFQNMDWSSFADEMLNASGLSPEITNRARAEFNIVSASTSGHATATKGSTSPKFANVSMGEDVGDDDVGGIDDVGGNDDDRPKSDCDNDHDDCPDSEFDYEDEVSDDSSSEDSSSTSESAAWSEHVQELREHSKCIEIGRSNSGRGSGDLIDHEVYERFWSDIDAYSPASESVLSKHQAETSDDGSREVLPTPTPTIDASQLMQRDLASQTFTVAAVLAKKQAAEEEDEIFREQDKFSKEKADTGDAGKEP